MQGFVQGADRQQTTPFRECLDDWVDESNSIRAVDVFVVGSYEIASGFVAPHTVNIP